MAIPLLGGRRERRQAQIEAAVNAEVEKALSPAVAMAAAQSQGSSGATYPVLNPSSPFAQTGGYGDSYAPLPRPDDTFNSLFGPGFPLVPSPLDPVGPNGRSMPRRSQYLVAWNLSLVDRQVPWTMLKWLAEGCDVVNRCIQLVQDGMVGREWSWGFSDDIIQQIMAEENQSNHARAMAIAKDKYGSELDRVKEFFQNPDPRMGQTFSQWLTEMVWDHLVYDGIAVYPQYNLGGELTGLSLIDPTTIKVLRDNQGYKPLPPAPAYQQILYGFPRGEYQASASDDESVTGEYQNDQLSYYVRRQRPESVYGYPQVEEVMTVATTYLNRQAWMAAEYTNGSMPRTFFKISEASTWTPEQDFAFEQVFNDRLTGQIQRRQQAFLLPNGMEPIFSPQMDEKYKADYDNFLIVQIGSKLGVPASQLGVSAKAGLSGGKQMEGEEDQTEHFVFNAIISFFIDIMNDLARRYLNVDPEITATCQDPGGSEQDIVQQATADQTVVGFGGMTLNDYRSDRGQPLYDMPEADEPMIITATGPVFLKGTLAVQDATTENTLNPPPPPDKVVVGLDGKPVPGGVVPNGTDDTGDSAGDDGSGSKPGGPSTDSDGNTEIKPDGSSDASGSTTDDKSDDDTKPGDDKSSSSSDKSGSGSGDESDSSDKGSDKDAAKGELAAFRKFAGNRVAKGTWRDFEFSAIGDVRGRELNDLGASGDTVALRNAIDTALKEVDHPKARAQTSGLTIRKADNHDWASQPGHAYHDAICAYYAPKLAKAFKDSLSGVQQAIADAKRKHLASKVSTTKAVGDGASLTPAQEAAQAAVSSTVTMSREQATNILKTMYGDSYVSGAHAAATQVGPGATLTADLEDVTSSIDWDTWAPGWAEAADLTRLGGLQTLLDNAGVTISSIEDSMMTRLGNVLADGLSAGDPAQVIANNIGDMVEDPDRAYMIATTETSRTMVEAALDTYDANNIAQWEWLSEGDDRVCPECEDLDGQTFDVPSGDDSDDSDGDQHPPLHPRCRCQTIPGTNVPGVDTSREALAPEGDWVPGAPGDT